MSAAAQRAPARPSALPKLDPTSQAMLEGALLGLPWQTIARDYRTSLLLMLESMAD